MTTTTPQYVRTMATYRANQERSAALKAKLIAELRAEVERGTPVQVMANNLGLTRQRVYELMNGRKGKR